MNDRIERFIVAAGISATARVGVTSFGDSAVMQTELAELVIAGIKRATTSLRRSYCDEGVPLPVPGNVFVVLDGSGAPRCVCRTVRVAIRPFADVDAAFAEDEGEGDRTLTYWRTTHREFFAREATRSGISFDEAEDVVLEHFELIFVPASDTEPGETVGTDTEARCPKIATARLLLEPLTESHAAPLFTLLRDPILWQFTEQAPPESLAALRARYRRLEARQSPDGAQHWLNWVIVIPGDGPGGFVQATVSKATGSGARTAAEIAYILASAYRSRGFATEAVAAMLAFLEDTLDVGDFHATVDERNVASSALLERLHFTRSDATDPRNVRWKR